MERCVDELDVDEDSSVLEIGFGCGYSAEHIQRCCPRSHTVIECSEVVLRRLRPWAALHPGVTVIEGTWQAVLHSLGTFDCIFFDDVGAPGLAEAEMRQCPNAAYRAEYHNARDAGRSHFHAFMQIAFRWHAHLGTRLSGYLLKHDEPERADVEVRLSYMKVAPPEHCCYHDSTAALVSRFTKVAVLGAVPPVSATSQPTYNPLSSPSPSKRKHCADKTDDSQRSLPTMRSVGFVPCPIVTPLAPPVPGLALRAAFHHDDNESCKLLIWGDATLSQTSSARDLESLRNVLNQASH